MFHYLIYSKSNSFYEMKEKFMSLEGEDWIQFNLKTRTYSEIIPPKEASFPFLKL